ncbi:Ferredoxin [Caprobacter fermentans]|uniref:Ferredoxin n=1 Tax=Caproicibacter fermentans TaxID=2576756 RepID=A0A6N8I4S1_9FIRM|nr:ferredoxin [Caproicibacter fermentans]MVB13032.1 Ferredoxin [Caproicibacter fermentans]
MTALLDRKNCIGCGLCAYTCPEVFRMADDGYAKIIQERVPREAERTVLVARDECPVNVISVSKKENDS